MRKILIYIVFFVFSAIQVVYAQTEYPKEIIVLEKALKTKDQKLFIALLDDMVTITQNSKSNVYTKLNAQKTLTGMLDNEGTSFEMQKVGKGHNSNAYFCIGTLTTKNKQHLMYFYIVHDAEKDLYLLKEIKIE